MESCNLFGYVQPQLRYQLPENVSQNPSQSLARLYLWVNLSSIVCSHKLRFQYLRMEKLSRNPGRNSVENRLYISLGVIPPHQATSKISDVLSFLKF